MTFSHVLQKKPLYEQIVELIEAQIINGEIRVGDQLPIETEMAAQYQVSRTVIREAMKALKEKGWIETFVGKGTFVIDNVARGIDSSFELALRMDSGSSFKHLIEVRELLEPGIAALAAENASPEELAEIREAVHLMDKGIDLQDYETFLQGDFDFHVKIAQATGNPLIIMVLNRVVLLMRAQQEYHVYHEPSGGKNSQSNHKLILNALEKHDKEEAKLKMRNHILQVRMEVNNSTKTGKDFSPPRSK